MKSATEGSKRFSRLVAIELTALLIVTIGLIGLFAVADVGSNASSEKYPSVGSRTSAQNQPIAVETPRAAKSTSELPAGVATGTTLAQ